MSGEDMDSGCGGQGTHMPRRRFVQAWAGATLAMTVPASAMAPANNLAGKSVLITGCSSGFGRLTALHCARLGAKVVATMRNLPRPEGETLLQSARAERLDLHLVEIDVLQEQSVEGGVAAARAILGDTPDVLVNNAGIAIVGPVEAQDMAATMLAYDTNVFGYQRMIRVLLPDMRARGHGLLINMSSQSGRLIWPGLGHYCPTKFAVEAMSDSLAYEVADQGVEVSIIQPGGYPTDFWDNREALTLALKQRSLPKHLAGYGNMASDMGSGKIPELTGDPMDVAEAIARCIAVPTGQRPHRIQVSASGHPQENLNAAHRATQLSFLGRGPFGPAARKVHGAEN